MPEGRTVGPQPPRRAAVESSGPARVEAVTLCCCGGAMDIVRRSGCIQAVKLRSTCKLFELAIDIDARAAAPIMHHAPYNTPQGTKHTRAAERMRRSGRSERTRGAGASQCPSVLTVVT